MAQNKNSEGMWKKIYNAVRPFRRVISRQNTDQNPTKIPTPQISKMIPIEHGNHSGLKNTRRADSGDREIVIVSGKVEKVGSNKANKYKKDDEFSEYIRKVKNRMIKTTSSIGGAGERNEAKKDSFNDKVTNYINHAKIKIRATTTSGGRNEKNVSFK